MLSFFLPAFINIFTIAHLLPILKLNNTFRLNISFWNE